MPQLIIDLTELGLPVADASGWVEAVDSLGNPMPVVTTGTGALVFGARALDFDIAGRATIDLPATDSLQPAGARYRAYLTRRDATTVPVAVGPFALTADADLGEVADLPPSDVLAAFEEVIASAQAVLDTIGPLSNLAARVDGYLDHGDVSEVLAIDPNIGTHVLEATGDLLLTLEDATDGRVVSIYVLSGADSVTVDGIADLELTDGTFATFVRVRGTWVVAAAGASGGTTVPDTTPPSNITGLTATGGEGQIVLAWSAATDPESTVRYRYRVWRTSEGASGDYITTNTPGATVTGLGGGDYTAQVYAFSSGGTSAVAAAEATVTVGPGSFTTVAWRDTFTRANGSLQSSATPDVGAAWSGSTSNYTISSGRLTGISGAVITADHGVGAVSLLQRVVYYMPANSGGATVTLRARGSSGLLLRVNRESSRTYVEFAGGGSPTYSYSGDGSYSTLPGHAYATTQTLTLEVIMDLATFDVYASYDGGAKTRVLAGTHNGSTDSTLAYEGTLTIDSMEILTL